MILTVQRKAKMMQIKIKPERSKTDHMYKIGTWIRDNTQGIGTMTYVKVRHLEGWDTVFMIWIQAHF